MSHDERDSDRKGQGGTYHFISLEQDYPTSLVTCSKVVACRVELDGRYDVG